MKLVRKMLLSSIAVLVALPLLYVGPQDITAAATPTVKEISVALPLREGKLMEEDRIRQLANVHIDHYLAQDMQTHGMQLRTADTFLDVYDVSGNLFAYLVPLLDGAVEVGYITIGALEDGYDAYDIFIGDGVVDQLRAQLKEKSQGAEAQLVLIPPMQYLIKSLAAGSETFTSVTLDENRPPEDVTDRVQDNRAEINHLYSLIRSEENRLHIEQNSAMNAAGSFTGERASVEASAVVMAAVTKEDYALSTERNFDNFVPVEYTTGRYSYGGNQMWWPDGGQKENRGCGPVAAANITAYLAKVTNPSKYGKLYTKSITNYTDFLGHMDTMYSYISPGPFGETSVSSFSSAVEKYAKDKNVTLNRVTSNASFTLDNTAAYVKAGLALNSPVATLNLSKFSNYQYEWHWMTITKYYRDTNDNRWIAVSTWGQRRSINYRTHFNAIDSFFSLGGGFMYFK
ncbi:hypothetical protein [Paenibacillus sp. SYP-B4298]|uniref:hypothetical protein n=1 Tax=Paenibacillus sp. SYP-B4298 TaxID=2996034 RepID=UPI0022DE8217|nr:hypothetical protein [Paenibacillus sp. SYP-B4298]